MASGLGFYCLLLGLRVQGCGFRVLGLECFKRVTKGLKVCRFLLSQGTCNSIAGALK